MILLLAARPNTPLLSELLERASALGHTEPTRTFSGNDGDTPLNAILSDLSTVYTLDSPESIYPALRRGLLTAYRTGQVLGKARLIGSEVAAA